VLSQPIEHGLLEGVWYCADADEAILDAYGSHTLAGVFGCAVEHLGTLQNAFADRGLFDKTAPKTMQSSALTAKLGIACFRPENRRDGYIDGQQYTWVAFGTQPRYAPSLQLADRAPGQRPPCISPRTRALQSAILPHLLTSLPDPSAPQPAPAAPPTAPTARPRTRSAAPLLGSVDEVDSASGTPARGYERAGGGGGHVDAAGVVELARALAYAQDCAAAADKAERAAAAAAAKAVEAQAPKRARATDDAGVLVSARTKLAAHGGDVMAAAARQTQQHLSMPELKALLVSAGLQVGGKKQELAERYRDRAGEAGAGGSGSGDVHLDDAVDDEEEDDADLCEGVSEEVSDEEESDEEESDEEVSDEEESDEEVSDEEVSEEEESDGASGSESE
jgi:hypothetical protein